MKESERIRNKYPNRIPIIVKKKKDSKLPDIDKSKFLVHEDILQRIKRFRDINVVPVEKKKA